jgi:glycosyltransferase involved in cell wall biosynthesis
MDKNLNPKISVLMPVYNCRPYIEESVNSIFNQTYTDFEFIIIDDCSTDGTYEYLSALKDPRLNLISKPKNTGYTVSLNMGLEIAKGEYIARMDGDDISLLDRFAKQVEFMDKNLDIIVCGGAYEAIGSDFKFIPKYTNDDIAYDLMSLSPIAHPTSFFRNSILKKNNIKYNKEYEPAEDYKMWSSLSEYGKLANLKDVLLYYRVHPNQISSIRAKSQEETTKLIAYEHLKKLSKDNENFNFYFKVELNSIEDLIKYENVESDIILTLKERGIKINDRFFLDRKILFVKRRLYMNKLSIIEAKNNLNLLFKFRPILGNIFICKYLIKSLIYSIIR